MHVQPPRPSQGTFGRSRLPYLGLRANADFQPLLNQIRGSAELNEEGDTVGACACVCEVEGESMCLPLSISRNRVSSVTLTLCYMAL